MNVFEWFLQPYHVQFSFLMSQAGDGEGGEHGGSEGEVGVDGRPVLAVAVVRDG